MNGFIILDHIIINYHYGYQITEYELNHNFYEIKDIPEYKYFYNDEIRRLVKELYNLDIVKYNYEYPF